MKKFATLLAVAGIAIAGVAQDTPTLVSFSVGSDSFLNGMSRNGKWATFEKQSGEEIISQKVEIINLTTGKFVSYTPQRYVNYNGTEAELPAGAYGVTTGASDDGNIIFGTFYGRPAYYNVAENTWYALTMGSASNNRNYNGQVLTMSADCKRMAGWYFGESMTEFWGVVWDIEDGKPGVIRPMPALPTYKDLYDHRIIDKATYEEEKNQTPAFQFRHLSPDGNTLLVSVDHNRPQWGCSFGVYDLTNDTFKFIEAPLDNYVYSFINDAVMSENGEWVTGNAYFIGKDESGAEDGEGVFRYHVPTGKMELYTGTESVNMLATAIDNNGTVMAGTPGSQPIRNVAIFAEDLWVDLSKVLTQKYNYNFTAKTGFDNTGYPVAVSADCKTMLAQAEFRGGGYALTLNKDFAQAAAGTSLLTEYIVSPASGKQFSVLKDIAVRFTYGAVAENGTVVVVTDASGEEVGRSTAITSASSQNLVHSISFPNIELVENEVYTVTIPENTFIVPGTTMGNPEITVEYKGRGDAPVAYTKIDPEANSYINVFSVNSPVTVTFDTDLTISTAVQAKLFEEGKATAICNLSAAVNGKNLILYPAAERRLAKDRVYRIEVPAGLVRDLGYEGANNEFTITYNGAFVPTAEENSARPFFEDFSSPNEALYNFLLIDGDGHQPTEAMQTFGFDQWNTPWNFSVRDDGSYDYCAASHSLYTPVGTSDDWMMIPQLTLADGDYYLTFKGQSFAKDKKDYLKIFVWEYDEIIGSLDDTLLKKAKAEAKPLAEIQMVPSVTEGTLDGSWRDYEFPLAEFAGKRVYICFVNENTNQSLIFLDDIAVEYRGAYTLSVATENNLIEVDKTNVTAFVNVNAAGPFNEIEATISVPACNYTKTRNLTGLNLTSGSKHQIDFADVPLKKGEVNTVTVTTTMNGITQSYTGTIVNHAFEIARRVLVEEGTGSWCGNCPRGEVAVEHLETTMPDNVAIISVHNGDAYALTEYDTQLALGGYPNGRIDRLDQVFTPLYTDNGIQYTSPTGDVTFADMVYSELAHLTEGEIKIADPVYYSADKVISLPVDVRFSVSRDNGIYNVITVVLEDGLPGRQSNYYVGSSEPLMEWWGGQPSYVTYTYTNVARALIGGYYGMSGRVPTSIKAGEVYNSPLSFDLPSTVKDVANMHFVVALVDATTGKVINSDVCRVFEVNDTPGAGIEEILDDNASANVRMTVDNGTILVNGESDAEVYNVSGMRVRNSNLSKGIYIVRKAINDKFIYVGRIFVR